MAERLPVIRQAPASWIDWGAFLGGGADAVRAALPAARRQVVEPTAALLARSQAMVRRPWWSLGRRGEVPGVLEDDVPSASAQLVWANMVLQNSPQPLRTLARWHAALAEGGYLMFSTLGPNSLRELRALYAAQGWPVPHRAFVDMHDVGDQLLHSGFADPVMDQETLQLTWSSPEALLAELRGLGGNVDPSRHAGLRTPRWRERLLALLRERVDGQGRLSLSFEVVYGHAVKAAPRAAAGAPVAVPLDQVRASLRAKRAKPDGL